MPKYKRGTHQRWYKRRQTYIVRKDEAEDNNSSDDQSFTPVVEREAPEVVNDVVVVEDVPESQPVEDSMVISPPPRKPRQLQLNSWIPMPPGYNPPPVPRKPKKAKSVKYALGNTVPWDRPVTPQSGAATPEAHLSEEEEYVLPGHDHDWSARAQTEFQGHVAAMIHNHDL